MLKKQRILTIDVSTGSYQQFIDEILYLADHRTSSYVCIANVHMLGEAHDNIHFQNIVNAADIVTPDGMPLAKAFNILYGIKQVRVDGMSLLPALLKRSIAHNLKVYFYGGTPEMLESTKNYLSKKYPGLVIAGMYSPPFRTLTNDENAAIVNDIISSGANIVFVVLGCPKQEKWMAGVNGKIPAVLIGVGGALPVMIGLQKRAPVWMQQYSLEWLYRLKQEPRRLFKRYYSTNKLFIYLMLKAKLKRQAK